MDEIELTRLPAYLMQMYMASNFPKLNLTVEDFIHYNFIVYKLAPSGQRSQLTREQWIAGFNWHPSREGFRSEAEHEHS